MSITGLYSLGYKLGTLTNQFVTSPFVQIWGPRRYEHFNKGDSEKIYARIFTYFIFINLLAGLGISLYSKEAIQIMADQSFWPAYKIVPIVALSYIILSFNYHFNVGIIMKKATKYIAYANISNGILNLILNFILIKRYNVWGAAYATLICFTYKVAITHFFANRLYKIVTEWRRLLLLFGLAILCYLLSLSITTDMLLLDLTLKTLLFAAYPALLYYSRFFDENERKKIKRLLKTRKLTALFE